jgi:hypothetical protein
MHPGFFFATHTADLNDSKKFNEYFLDLLDVNLFNIQLELTSQSPLFGSD